MKTFDSKGKKVSIHEIFNAWGDGVQTIVVESTEDIRVLRIIHNRIGGSWDGLDNILDTSYDPADSLGIYTRGAWDRFHWVTPVLEDVA